MAEPLLLLLVQGSGRFARDAPFTCLDAPRDKREAKGTHAPQSDSSITFPCAPVGFTLAGVWPSVKAGRKVAVEAGEVSPPGMCG